MALIAENSSDRVQQLLLLTQRLTQLIVAETGRIEARTPTASSDLVEEKARLANAYRLELARIKDDRSLLEGVPQNLMDRLKAETADLQTALAAHDIALGAVKIVAEGLVQAMAEEVALQRVRQTPYSASGEHSGPAGPAPIALDKSA